MIYQTYTCSMADGTVEYGFCFKDHDDADDCCLEAEIVVGVTGVLTNESRDAQLAEMRAGWAKHEWMAQAVVAAAEARP